MDDVRPYFAGHFHIFGFVSQETSGTCVPSNGRIESNLRSCSAKHKTELTFERVCVFQYPNFLDFTLSFTDTDEVEGMRELKNEIGRWTGAQEITLAYYSVVLHFPGHAAINAHEHQC